jgi:hypothetical protein
MWEEAVPRNLKYSLNYITKICVTCLMLHIQLQTSTLQPSLAKPFAVKLCFLYRGLG